MPKVAILGAGAMGSGLANALVQAGWDVNLWGTWLDDHLIDAIEEGDNSFFRNISQRMLGSTRRVDGVENRFGVPLQERQERGQARQALWGRAVETGVPGGPVERPHQGRLCLHR